MEGSYIRKGFTLIETIISVSILVYISPLFLMIIDNMSHYDYQITERQNFIGIIQLRRSLSLGVNHSINQNEVCMIYNDENMCFEQFENNLIAYPGTQYFLVKVHDVNFEMIDNWLVINYLSESKEYSIKLIQI